MRVLSVPQDHCGSHNDFIKIFSKNYTLYCVYIFPNFGIRLTRLALNGTKTLFYISKGVLRLKKDYIVGSNFINLSENLVK